MTPDPLFPCLSPESAQPGAIPVQMLLAEMERELLQRRTVYPGRVEKGIMDRAAAEHGIDIAHALTEDLRADAMIGQIVNMPAGATPPADAWSAYNHQRSQADAALRAFRWPDIVAALQQDIAHRRDYYPRWVSRGTLDPTAARQQLERIEAVHFRWWVLGHHFGTLWSDGGDDAWRTAWRTHAARFDLSSDRGAYAPVRPMRGKPCGAAQFDHLLPEDPRAPWIRAEIYPDGPHICPCGHHEGYHGHDRKCLFSKECRCAGLPDDCYTPIEAFHA